MGRRPRGEVRPLGRRGHRGGAARGGPGVVRRRGDRGRLRARAPARGPGAGPPGAPPVPLRGGAGHPGSCWAGGAGRSGRPAPRRATAATGRWWRPSTSGCPSSRPPGRRASARRSTTTWPSRTR
ncbi:hypothetical protein [Nocardioides convexus]|uniref:hypothetical protein n=1 Tax=Nocardioides convexus TaxID=2712224 RepID=UPI0024183974|nr:hypothetical protein [Nocardioides convexus]